MTDVTVAVVADAALGDFMLSSAHAYAPLPPVLVIARLGSPEAGAGGARPAHAG